MNPSNQASDCQSKIRQPAQPPEKDRLMCGDYFTHERTGVRFVCRAVTHHDYGGSAPILRAKIEVAPK